MKFVWLAALVLVGFTLLHYAIEMRGLTPEDRLSLGTNSERLVLIQQLIRSQNLEEVQLATRWLEKLGSQGELHAMTTLAWLYLHGEASKTVDLPRGLALLAAARTGDVETGKTLVVSAHPRVIDKNPPYAKVGLQMEVAEALTRSKKPSDVVNGVTLMRSLGATDPHAFGRLAWIYWRGAAGMPSDPKQCVALLAEAAEGGCDNSRQSLVNIYAQGMLGIPADPAKAAFWRERRVMSH